MQLMDSTRTPKITHLKCEYLVNPIGIDCRAPRFSWQLASDGYEIVQHAYQILVSDSRSALEKELGNCWDSGIVKSAASIQQAYGGVELHSRQRYYWKVRIWLDENQPSEWSEIAFWEMALINADDWQARWISADEEGIHPDAPAPLLRKVFHFDGEIEQARLYITSLGLYEAYINGKRIGDQFFTPGWTSYHKRLQYQTYDVSDLIREGENVIAVWLGNGWYRGRLGWMGRRAIYGDRLALFAQLELQPSHGERIIVISDEDWKSALSALIKSQLYDGETYDARLEEAGWNSFGFDDKNWKKVYLIRPYTGQLVAASASAVRAINYIRPKQIISHPDGEYIFDFGQNMVGWVRLLVEGEAGTVITIRHAEVLDRFGNLYTDNLRSAKQSMTYILKGHDLEIYQPHFSFQGFRYVSVRGYPDTPTFDSLLGVVLHSDMPSTGTFTCSNPLIDQLYQNIVWSQKGNFLDVPTDCPQRDERLGWTGDAQVFALSAAMNMDVSGFFTKWLRDLAADQRQDGSVPHVVPDMLEDSGSSAWGDAAVIVPWVIYQIYGDQRILEEQFESMQRWVDYIHAETGDDLIWNSGFHFGDWLASLSTQPLFPKPVTNTDLIATAFFAYSTDLLARSAETLGKDDLAQTYRSLCERIKLAFNREFVSPSGRIGSNTQAAYVIPLMFNLLPKDQRKDAAQRLVNLIENNNGHLSTGFVSTPYICHVLTRFGYSEIAYQLLTQESPPSWLYAVKKGATTIWEHWNSLKPDGSFQDPLMNSFNHYANGAIADWLYQVVAGIRQAEPGFKNIIIQPIPGGGLTYAKASYQSMYGRILSAWKIIDSKFILEIQIPPNTHAQIYLPDGSLPNQVGSGCYRFSCPWRTS